MNNKPDIASLVSRADTALTEVFKKLDATAFHNQKKVMDAFYRHRISEQHFYPTTGYGYNDKGREGLDAVWADVFGAQSALVRHSVVSGTHALNLGLFGLLRPGDTLLSVTGKPYDTLEQAIGLSGEVGQGSLRDWGVRYRQIDLREDGSPDLNTITETVRDNGTIKVVFVQRSRGYSSRPALPVMVIGEIVHAVKSINPDVFVMVDNCYGEFVEVLEPTDCGADLAVGSLIKNPGGGIAESGAYFAGTKKAVELVSYRLTSPGIGAECGASLGHTKEMIKGLFFAPHAVAQALKTACFAAYMLEELGYKSSPRWDAERHDIVQSLELGSPEGVCAFCRGIQRGAPVDSFVVPEPWDMPGYSHPVIMAAGAFTQGASLELSADAPMRPPYTVFMQGGLTWESGKLGVLYALEELLY